MKKVIKYTFRVLLLLLAVIILLVVLAGIFIQTDYFKSKLPPIIEKTANSYLNGTLKVDQVRGNLFKGLVLTNVVLMDGTDTVAFIPEFSAQYNLLSLLRKKLEITSAKLNHPFVSLKQINDSTWNIQQMIVLPQNDSSDTTSSSFTIELKRFTIEQGSIKIAQADTVIPKKIEQLNLALSLFYSANSQNVKIEQFSMQTQEPHLLLKEFTGDIRRKGEAIEVLNLNIKTALNEITAHGNYSPNSKFKSNLDIKTTPLYISEFEYYIPGIELLANPTFELIANAQNDSLNATIKLENKESLGQLNRTGLKESINLDIGLDNFPAIVFDQTDSLIRYTVLGKFQNINLANWGALPQMNYQINGNISAKGVGANPETLISTIEGNFQNSIIENYKVDQLGFEFEIDRGDIKGEAAGSGKFGKVNITPIIRGFTKKNPSYSIKLLAQNLNLALITGQDSLTSDLNLKANVSGYGFNPKTLDVKANIYVVRSLIAGVSIDTALANINYSSENLVIDSLRLQTKSLLVKSSGNYSLHSTSNIILLAYLKSLDEFSAFIPLKNLNTNGELNARLWGPKDSLNLEALLMLNSFDYDSIMTDKILIDANALLTQNDTLINAQITVNNIRNNIIQIDSINAVITSSLDSAFVVGKVANHILNTNFDAGINWSDKLRVRLDNWIVNYKDQKWSLQESPALFEIDSTTYSVKNFKLASNGNDSLGYLWADGFFSTNSNQGFDLKIANLSIKDIAKLSGQEIDATGKINVEMSVNGTASSPKLIGNFSIEKPIFNEYVINKFQGNIDYELDRLKFEGEIVPRDSGRIELMGELPMQLRLDSMSFNISSKENVSGTMFIDRFPLAIFQTFNLAEEIKGYLEGSASVNGPLSSLNPYGSFRLTDASFRIPQYGIDYRKVLFNTSLQNDKIIIDTFQIHSSKGKVTAQGKIDFVSDFYKGNVRNSTVEIKFDKFNPFDHRLFNVQMSGDASLAGKKGEVVFGGDIIIPKAEINLPFLFNILGKFSTPTIPKSILMQEIERQKTSLDSLVTDRQSNKSKVIDSINIEYLKNFTGKIKVNIPRNTWIKNDDMRIELSGDLELRKNKGFFELFGTVDVVRGQYDLFGRTFKIDQGTITFHGGEGFKPEVNIEASYTFRNSDKAEQALAVNISGTMETPKVNFTLDGSSINEGDALSYIIFGRSLNELTISQQENISGSGTTSMAGSAAASLLSSQLTKFLGDKLDVDYIEVKSGGNFENATVTVGKYITNDIFVSYEKRFGETSQKDIDKYEVKLEYLIFKFLFFQLNNSSSDSGFDVIFKLESK